ncbi:hypothetical protein PsorP6_006003 [Peronosclerospora sorghi]|uniref:Uncharacterized protein n=1 Tax=Peronosclerospora sorghi TaxID=230839 RepID=A0ACC0W4A1_9STRA|nr:hypothetical protein PsorP6_006003 [Peronosclerospora sorghi]
MRKRVLITGYRGTVSGDLQQLASHVIWMNDIWSRVKNTQQVNFQEKNRRDESCRRESRLWEDQYYNARLRILMKHKMVVLAVM